MELTCFFEGKGNRQKTNSPVFQIWGGTLLVGYEINLGGHKPFS